MLAGILVIFALAWGLWFAFLARYPHQWNAQIDQLHARLQRQGLSVGWMKAAEKGVALKVIVAATTILALVCLIIVLHHPTALTTYLRNVKLIC